LAYPLKRITAGNKSFGAGDTPVKQEQRRKIDKEKLKQAAAEKPDAFLKELAEPFDCTAAAVFYALEKINMNSKKKTFTYYEKSALKRAEYQARIRRVPRSKRVYIAA
jgi:hypothetical protein